MSFINKSREKIYCKSVNGQIPKDLEYEKSQFLNQRDKNWFTVSLDQIMW